MKRLINTTIFASLIFALSSPLLAQSSDQVTEAWKVEVQNSMQGLSKAPSTLWKGMAITFISDSTYWTTSIGQANDTGLAIDPDGKWLYRSYTKMMVSVIILQLYEEDKLDLKDPISKYLDPIVNVNMSDTIEDLLHMQSRMCRYIDRISIEVDEDKSAVLDTRALLEEHLPTGPCNDDREYDYNDANFQVLGLIIEAVEGKSGEEVFNERIIEPYGLDRTILAPLNLDRNDYNGLYRSEYVENEDSYISYDESMESLNSLLTSQKYSAGIMSSTSDMILFTKALLDSVVLEDSTLGLMKINPITDAYGKGLMIQEMKGGWNGDPFNFPPPSLYTGKFYGHSGQARNTSRTFYDPVRKIGFSFAFNSSNPGKAWWSTERFKENMYRILRKCLDDGGCKDLGSRIPTPIEFDESPVHFSLSQNYPNPFNPSTNISFELPQSELVRLKVYNMLGQEVANLVDGRMNSGNHTVNFDASNLSSGMYIYRLTAGNQSFTKKMMLIK